MEVYIKVPLQEHWSGTFAIKRQDKQIKDIR